MAKVHVDGAKLKKIDEALVHHIAYAFGSPKDVIQELKKGCGVDFVDFFMSLGRTVVERQQQLFQQSPENIKIFLEKLEDIKTQPYQANSEAVSGILGIPEGLKKDFDCLYPKNTEAFVNLADAYFERLEAIVAYASCSNDEVIQDIVGSLEKNKRSLNGYKMPKSPEDVERDATIPTYSHVSWLDGKGK